MVKPIHIYSTRINVKSVPFVMGTKATLQPVAAELTYELDTETNVVDYLYHRELYWLQIGTSSSIHLFDMNYLTADILTELKSILGNDAHKYGHNLIFDISLIEYRLGVAVRNCKDTFLAAKILTTGLINPKGTLSLAGLVRKYFDIDLDKTEQTNFTADSITKEQLVYAAEDVAGHVTKLYAVLEAKIKDWGMTNTLNLENRLLEVMSHSMQPNNGLNFNTDKWVNTIMAGNAAIMEEKLATLNAYLLEHHKPALLALNYYTDTDIYTFNWRARAKDAVLAAVFPTDLTSYTLTDIKKYLKQHPDTDNVYLDLYLNNKTQLETLLISHNRDLLISAGLCIPAGTLLLNWSSPEQVLNIFKIFDSTVVNTEKATVLKLKKLQPEFFSAYQTYKKYEKRVSSYGMNFVEAVYPNGKLPILDYNQILNTGRISMKLLQLLPAEHEPRSVFYPDAGDSLVACDYASQEACVAAVFAQEEKMIEAVKSGKDLHSINASLVFPKEWADSGEGYEFLGKPKTKAAQYLRGACKAVIFGAMYGKGIKSLAEDLEITLQEAQDIFTRVFTTFPKLKQFLETNAIFASTNLYISTPDVFARKRFFTPWHNYGQKAEIERQGQNFPVQSVSANMSKYALTLLYKELKANPKFQACKIHFPVHDEIVSSAPTSIVEEWAATVQRCMEAAGTLVLGMEIQKAEYNITETWTK
jgi:DNA polymerase I-like protein with 3'-5' exonuclease and polymerase domains